VQKHQLGFLSPTTHCLKFFADIFTLLSWEQASTTQLLDFIEISSYIMAMHKIW
jgi:hypothetical protein